ncbi:MAG: hypothetical protein K8J31_27885, partial [Anaerolineae bacterium]|nr:hypothetical protein [Anaerolineae bacterium]
RLLALGSASLAHPRLHFQQQARHYSSGGWLLFGSSQVRHPPNCVTSKEIDFLNYTISDYLIGLRVTRNLENIVDPYKTFSVKFNIQMAILYSSLNRLDSILTDITGTLQANLFDDELSAAEELFKKGHLRAAGALAGVTLERHLATVAQNHEVKISKKNPTIVDFNEALKAAEVYDVPDWRFIQRLGDIRNLAVHNKDREPTQDEIDDLIKGTTKIIKTIF